MAAADRLRVLVIDDDPAHAEVVSESLARVDYDCATETSGAAALKRLERDEFDVVVTDLRLGDLSGMEVVRTARQERPDAAVVVVTGHADIKTAVEAMQLGATHYLEKPVDLAALRLVVEKAADRRRLARDNEELRRQLDEKYGFEAGFLGESPAMRRVFAQLRSLAPTRATVLVTGENGTGKELVARALHANSPRRAKPFVAMNCAALNENLLDDEMFGHEAGAFTGGDRQRKGRFEYATGGTLFLDEVGDMPLALQAKLLRVLENGEVTRIGSNEVIKVDVRLVAATNRSLEQLITENKFRTDLYYRLKVATVRLPALRERREDIPLLTAHFLKEANQKHGKKVNAIADPVRRAFAGYAWPGNVRELRNAVESMVVMDHDGALGLDDVQEEAILAHSHAVLTARAGADELVGQPLSFVERYYAERTLAAAGGNREEAARQLGIGERTLYRMMQEWKLQDRIRQALDEADGDTVRAAELLGLKPETLARKLKRLGHREDGDDEGE